MNKPKKKIVRFRYLEQVTGMSRAACYREMERNPDFPKRINALAAVFFETLANSAASLQLNIIWQLLIPLKREAVPNNTATAAGFRACQTSCLITIIGIPANWPWFKFLFLFFLPISFSSISRKN